MAGSFRMAWRMNKNHEIHPDVIYFLVKLTELANLQGFFGLEFPYSTHRDATLFRDAFPCYFFVKFFSRCILEKQMPRICQFGWVFRLENWVQPALN